MREDSKRSKILGAIVIVLTLFGWLFLLTVTSNTDDVELPSQVTSKAVPKVEPTQVQSPRPERTPHKPPSQSRIIYVVAQNVPSVWGLQAVLKAWSAAKYTDSRLVVSCPVANPCVTVKMDPKLAKTDNAAVTDFGYNNTIVIRLNPLVKTPLEAQSTMCHEYGHVLGAPHIKGTANSCMPASGDYRVLPTKVDLSVVDRLGHWDLEKMYQSAFREVDVRVLPK